jgi:hypothetical protein
MLRFLGLCLDELGLTSEHKKLHTISSKVQFYIRLLFFRNDKCQAVYQSSRTYLQFWTEINHNFAADIVQSL